MRAVRRFCAHCFECGALGTPTDRLRLLQALRGRRAGGCPALFARAGASGAPGCYRIAPSARAGVRGAQTPRKALRSPGRWSCVLAFVLVLVHDAVSYTHLDVYKRQGLPLAYNKDLQEDKEAVFDALDTVNLCLDVLPPMLQTATFFPERMRAAAAAGFLNATDCADYLVSKGVPFRDAYAVSGQLVRLCVERGETLDTLPLEEYQKVHPAFGEDVYPFIDLTNCVSKRKVYGLSLIHI